MSAKTTPRADGARLMACFTTPAGSPGVKCSGCGYPVGPESEHECWELFEGGRRVTESRTKMPAQGIEARQGGDIERLKASAEDADAGLGVSLSGLSRSERRELLNGSIVRREPDPKGCAQNESGGVK
jgi:hypothetical protein